MLTTGLFALLLREDGSEAVQPLAAADQQIVRGQRIGEFLKPLGVTATQEGVGGLLKVDVLLLHAEGEPVMLVETDAAGKGEVGAHADARLDRRGLLHRNGDLANRRWCALAGHYFSCREAQCQRPVIGPWLRRQLL